MEDTETVLSGEGLSHVGATKTRARAWELLCRYTHGESLRRHALAVEAAMRAAATRYGDEDADIELWGATGLLHDFDYEQYPTPEQHPFVGVEILRAEGYPEEMLEAILGHAAYTGVPRRTRLARALFGVDELCGFVVACALVRPSRSLADMDAASVRKKLKDKAFARTVSRDDVITSAAELGVELNEHIEFVLGALRPIETELGLGTKQS